MKQILSSETGCPFYRDAKCQLAEKALDRMKILSCSVNLDSSETCVAQAIALSPIVLNILTNCGDAELRAYRKSTTSMIPVKESTCPMANPNLTPEALFRRLLGHRGLPTNPEFLLAKKIRMSLATV